MIATVAWVYGFRERLNVAWPRSGVELDAESGRGALNGPQPQYLACPAWRSSLWGGAAERGEPFQQLRRLGGICYESMGLPIGEAREYSSNLRNAISYCSNGRSADQDEGSLAEDG